MNYEAVIGLEIHSQLITETKIFCGCSTRFGAAPNTNVCPVCLGLPGALPVLSERAVEYAVRASLALGCTVHPVSVFARKNYFYPDLPKGYQISQYEEPLATDGVLTYRKAGSVETVRILRVHLEEDAGKSIHEGFEDSRERTYLDFNRSGVPLVEIVTHPDLRSSARAAEFFERLRDILIAVGVNDGNMEEGSLRCDANVSIRPKGVSQLGVKVEVKNINSFRFLEKAIDFEIERQTKVIDSGGKVIQETRSWDVESNRTFSMRSKEEAHDYRYFPEPDLPALHLLPDWIETVREGLGELPEERKQRFMVEFELAESDAEWIAKERDLARFFEEVAISSGLAKTASHWVMGPLVRSLKQSEMNVSDIRVTPTALAELIQLVESGMISNTVAKKIFEQMYATGRSAQKIVTEEGLSQMGDVAEIRSVVESVLSAQPDAISKYRSGKKGVLGFLVGQVMKNTDGKANPKLVRELLDDILGMGS